MTFDKADPSTGREAVGKGLGVVDEFSTDGRLIARIASGGALNAPWGLAVAPASWSPAEHGRYFANHVTGQVVDKSTGGTNAVWFTSGIDHEQDGLLGVLRP